MLNVLDECECFRYIIACLYFYVCFIFHAFYYDVHGARFPEKLAVGLRPLHWFGGGNMTYIPHVMKKSKYKIIYIDYILMFYDLMVYSCENRFSFSIMVVVLFILRMIHILELSINQMLEFKRCQHFSIDNFF